MPGVFLLPLLAALADSIYLTIMKFFFRKFGRLTNREFVWLTFATIVGILLAISPTLGPWPSWQEIRTVFWPLVGVIVLASANNLLYSWGIEQEKISEVQPFLVFTPLMTIMMVSLFYPDERVWQIYLASAIAGVFLVWSHLKKSHFVWSLGLAAICGFILLYSFEIVLLRQVLPVFSPLVLYLTRCSAVLVIMTVVARPRFAYIKPRHVLYFLLMGALAVVSTWASYTAFKLIGVTHTLFVLVLSSILVYWFSAIFLGERWKIRNLISSGVILALVIWVSTIQ